MALKTANNATTQLTASISAGQTTLPVLNTARFPTLGGGDYCYLTLVSLTGGVDNYGNPNVFEIVKVTGPFTPGGTVLTVVRGQDGTSPTAFAVGDVTDLRINRQTLIDSASVGGALLSANNLSDVASVATSRTNLGLGSAALLASSAVLQTANNLSDVASAATSRTNLGLGALATVTPPGNTTTFLRGDTTYSNTLAGALTAAGFTSSGDVDFGATNSLKIQLRRTQWSWLDDGTSGTSKTIDFSNYQKHKLQATGNCTVTFTAPVTDGEIVLVVRGDGTTRTFTWPGTVVWENNSVAVMPLAVDDYLEIRGRYDGTSYLLTWGRFGY